MFESFAPLKLRPGRKFDLRAFSEAERRALQAGIEQGHAEIRGAASRSGKTIDGWTYGERHLGNFGDDYLYRAATALTGLGAPGAGRSGLRRLQHRLRAAGRCRAPTATTHLSGRRPAAGARLLVARHVRSDAGRAALLQRQSDRPLRHRRSHTRGLQKAPDGSLTLYLQRDVPAGERAGELAARAAGPMRLVLRAYEPDDAADRGPLSRARRAAQLSVLRALGSE